MLSHELDTRPTSVALLTSGHGLSRDSRRQSILAKLPYRGSRRFPYRNQGWAPSSRDVQHIFGDCFDDHRLQVDASAPVSWHGNHFTEVPEHLAPWVVWECFELGFRYDLLALDKYMRRTSGVDGEVRREDLLSRVFPRSSFLAVDRLPHIDSSGLFACLPHRRVHSLNALRDVMILWPGCPASIMDSPYLSLTSTSSAIEALEFQLASFYVNLFYSVSGRPPVLPHLGPYESSSISGSALAA